jgi:hypothetical protein
MDIITTLAYQLSNAIAIAEGFYVSGSLPFRCHNPCDLELGDRGWGVDNGKTIYANADPNSSLDDHTDGWAAARRECIAILSGKSFYYSLDMTFNELSQRYTGNDNAGPWCKIVTEKLNVNPLDTIAQWIKANNDVIS